MTTLLSLNLAVQKQRYFEHTPTKNEVIDEGDQSLPNEILLSVVNDHHLVVARTLCLTSLCLIRQTCLFLGLQLLYVNIVVVSEGHTLNHPVFHLRHENLERN